MNRTSPGVLLIAVDGWGYKLIKKYLSESRLPALQKIASEGVFGRLPSVIPYITVPAWPAMLTGKNPGKLGVYAFLERNPAHYGLKTVTLQWEKWSPLWDVLKNKGKRSIIFNVPTVAAEFDDFPGKVVSGPIMDKKEDVIAYPPELNKELMDDNYKIYAAEFEKVTLDEFVEKIREVTEKQSAHMIRMLESETWDFFMAGFYYGDVLQHRLWQFLNPDSPSYNDNPKYKNVVLEYMEMVDKCIAAFLSKVPEDCSVLIASDHGLGPCRAKVDLNTWLYENGYMYLKRDEIHTVRLSNIRKYSLYFTLQALYKKLAFIPPLKKLRDWLWERIPKAERSWKDVDWDNTRAYSTWYSVHINLKGREPRGTVEPGEAYSVLRDEIIEKLMLLTDPETGAGVVKKIWRKEEVYNGPYMERMPDLLVEFAGDSLYWSTTGEIAPGTKLIDTSAGYSGAHVRDGIILCYGPAFRKGEECKNAQILDVAPTILHLLDTPIPSDIDGRVLKEIFRPDSPEFNREISYKEVCTEDEEHAEPVDEEEDQRIKDRLKSLGYLD